MDAVLADESAGGILVHIHILPEIIQPGFLVEFVHFQAGGFRGRRVVLLAGQGGAEAVDAPASGRDLPGQGAVRGHLVRQVDGLERAGGRGGRRVVHQVVRGGETGLLFGVVDARNRVQDKLVDGRGLRRDAAVAIGCIGHIGDRIGDQQPEMAGCRHGNVDGLLGHGAGGNPADFGPVRTVIAGLQDVAEGRRCCLPLSADVAADQGERTDRPPLREAVLEPAGPVLHGGDLRPVGEVAVGQHLHGEITAA